MLHGELLKCYTHSETDNAPLTWKASSLKHYINIYCNNINTRTPQTAPCIDAHPTRNTTASPQDNEPTCTHYVRVLCTLTKSCSNPPVVTEAWLKKTADIIHVNPERSFRGTNGDPPSEASQLRKGGPGVPPRNF